MCGRPGRDEFRRICHILSILGIAARRVGLVGACRRKVPPPPLPPGSVNQDLSPTESEGLPVVNNSCVLVAKALVEP
jgi:hypothetical protein